MEALTLNQLLLDALRQYDKPELLWYKQGGTWRKISTRAFLCRVASLAATLRELSIEKGDRVALFSENRPEWHIADLAILGLGAINVPVYPAESLERLGYILQHSESRLCFLSGKDQLGKINAIWTELPALEIVIPFTPVEAGELPGGRRVLNWNESVREDIPDELLADFERTARAHHPEDVASLIYTSGTTGVPKGALLTQRNLGSNVSSLTKALDYGSDDVALSLLPLCHIYERTNAYCYLQNGVTIAYGEGFDKVIENMREVRPAVMAVVPRFFEKFYTGLMERVHAQPAWKQAVFNWAVAVGREVLPCLLARRSQSSWLALRYRLADWLVYRKLRMELGGRMRCFISGAAPLARGLNEFFHALGFTIYEGYGLTETSPVISVNTPGAVKLGTVGRPIAGVEVTIAEDGEILTRGPHVMKGYYKMEKETQEVLRDGWFYTGDVGFLDSDGFLTITDRKKDLIKTAGGKYVAPQPIENRLKQSRYIQSAVVLGDRRKYVVGLLVPNRANLERYAAERGIAYGSPAELLDHPAVREVVAAEVDSVNRELAQYERLKRFALLEEDFSFDNGQLTYTQKVRRRKIEEHYRDLIESLYQEETKPVA